MLTGRAVPGLTPEPYRPLTEALAGAVRRDVSADGLDLAGVRVRLGRLLPDWSDDSSGPSDGGESPILLAEAVKRLLEFLGQPDGCLLLLEDLHWADVESLDVIEYLATALTELPVLAVATVRPEGTVLERLARWRRYSEVAVLPIEPLTERGVRQVIAACLETDDVPPEAVACVAANSEGNPFLIEELLAGLVTSGRLIRVGDGWAAKGELRPSVP